MTQRETINAIKALGLIVSYSSEYGEWRVAFPMPPHAWEDHEYELVKQEEGAYYTDDAEDALHTAQCLAKG